MKILYGVQATGNGHISRSREVIGELKNRGHHVCVILSGRKPSLLWDMEAFEPYSTFRGLTFASFRGKVSYLRTAFKLNLFRFYWDILSFDAASYGLVITDFEPISARIAKLNKIPSIGVGHQYAFFYDIPVRGANPLARFVVRNFAPADYAVGLHWHHFNQPILPPIIPHRFQGKNKVVENKILMYLPFEQLDDIKRLIQSFKDYHFFVYHRLDQAENQDNIHLRLYSRTGFLRDLAECNGVIANAGFELTSEALHLGKKVLVKPLAGQMEQLSNARVISQLNLGMVMNHLNSDTVAYWLDSPNAHPIRYPNVARIIAQWIENGRWDDIDGLAKTSWKQVQPQP
jgi:uncharacterized protein (TIGR00661 family)